jgi:hypothetical protein
LRIYAHIQKEGATYAALIQDYITGGYAN